MHRLAFVLQLMLLIGCGLGIHTQSDLPLRSKATVRNCRTRLEVSGAGHAMSGIRGEIEEYPAARRFSDNWVDVEWLVERRALHARVTNRTKAAITIDSLVFGPDKIRSGTPVVKLEPGFSQHIAVSSLDLIQEYFNAPRSTAPGAGTNGLHVEVVVRFAEQECSYYFEVAAGAD